MAPSAGLLPRLPRAIARSLSLSASRGLGRPTTLTNAASLRFFRNDAASISAAPQNCERARLRLLGHQRPLSIGSDNGRPHSLAAPFAQTLCRITQRHTHTTTTAGVSAKAELGTNQIAPDEDADAEPELISFRSLKVPSHLHTKLERHIRVASPIQAAAIPALLHETRPDAIVQAPTGRGCLGVCGWVGGCI